jgi:hypothetical protein
MIKKIDDSKCWQECGEIGPLWKYKIMQSLWRNLEVPQKIKYKVNIWPRILLLDICARDLKTFVHTEMCT